MREKTHKNTKNLAGNPTLAIVSLSVSVSLKHTSEDGVNSDTIPPTSDQVVGVDGMSKFQQNEEAREYDGPPGRDRWITSVDRTPILSIGCSGDR